MTCVLFTSHDGFGLGHVRRNIVIADAVRRCDPAARAVIVTGVERDVPWLRRSPHTVVRVPSLTKLAAGRYDNEELGAERALARRAEVFDLLVAEHRPDVVVVDRHPYGVDGELRPGLDRLHRQGGAAVLGLRDIIDEAPIVRAEVTSARWDGVSDSFDDVLVYGAQHLCDHREEYGIDAAVTYTGWIADRPAPVRRSGRDERLLVVAAGGGADGRPVRRIAAELLARAPGWRGVLVRGPFGDDQPEGPSLGDRLSVVRTADGCHDLLARAGASVQMAGYNTTIEALTAGLRPILVPRRAPRREQAIRAIRLASMGLADVVDEAADAGELMWLLDRPRQLRADELERAGLPLDGAERAARHLLGLVTTPPVRRCAVTSAR